MKRGKRICRRHVDLVSGVPCDHASDHHAVIVIIIIITITTDNQKCVILNNEKHFWWNSLCVTSSVAKPCTLHTQKVMGLSTNLNQLVGGLEPFFSIQLGISSSQLTKLYFSEGLVNHQPVKQCYQTQTINIVINCESVIFWLALLRTLAKWRQGAHTYRFAGLSDLAGRGGQRPR